jgi:hypothetical protein
MENFSAREAGYKLYAFVGDGCEVIKAFHTIGEAKAYARRLNSDNETSEFIAYECDINETDVDGNYVFDNERNAVDTYLN